MNVWKLIVGLVSAVAVMAASGCNYFKPVTPDNAKGVIYVYTINSCSACQMAKPVIQQLKDDGFKVRIIDCRRHPKKAGKAGVHMLPTFIHYRDGKPTRRIVGTASYHELLRMYR